MQRNTLFGGLALMAAGGLIGAGAMISSNAMAATDAPPPANEMTMINVGPDGDAVKCTFSGAEVEGMLPALPAMPTTGADAVPVEAVNGTGGGVFAVTGIAPVDGVPIEIDPNNPPEGVLIASGTITVDASVPIGDLPVLTSGNGIPVEGLPAEVKVLSADDAREGTPEECAAMREGAVAVATQGAVQVISGSTSVDAAGAATKP